jgi:hypothetical protein
MMASSLTLPSWRHHFGDVTRLAHLAMALFCGMLAALGVVYGLGGSVVHLVILLAYGKAQTSLPWIWSLSPVLESQQVWCLVFRRGSHSLGGMARKMGERRQA